MRSSASILICTRNRAESLRQTLAALGICHVPSDVSAELLVIDNGSTDHTREVVQACRLSNLPIRYVTEDKAGQCHARNRGLAESNGAVVLFTDDDVRPPANWIDGMCRPILNGHADAVVGGITFPSQYDSALSPLAIRNRRAWFASTESIDPAAPNRMVGANMAFGRHVLRDVPSFDVHLGPGALGFGDETLFSYRLLDHGYRLISAFDVAVEHHFDLSRLDRRSMLDAAVRIGRSEGYIEWHWRHANHAYTPTGELLSRAGLWRHRLANLHRSDLSDPAFDWELKRVQLVAFRQQYVAQSHGPRRYQRKQSQPATAATA